MPRYFELDVTLQEIQPRIRRRFSIRTTSTFAQLHNAIQQGFGWQDYHLWEFRLPTANGAAIAGVPQDEDFGRPTPNAREVKLSSYFTGKNVTEWCESLYDFDAEETAEMLLGWMDNDNHGFRYQLEREAVKALTKKGSRSSPPGCGSVSMPQVGRRPGKTAAKTATAAAIRAEPSRPFIPPNGMWMPMYRSARRPSWSRSTARSSPEYSNPVASPSRPSPGSSVASSSGRKSLWAAGRATSWST